MARRVYGVKYDGGGCPIRCQSLVLYLAGAAGGLSATADQQPTQAKQRRPDVGAQILARNRLSPIRWSHWSLFARPYQASRHTVSHACPRHAGTQLIPRHALLCRPPCPPPIAPWLLSPPLKCSLTHSLAACAHCRRLQETVRDGKSV